MLAHGIGLWTREEQERQDKIDEALSFDEELHQYAYADKDGKTINPQSVTRVVHDLFDSFDSKAIASGMVQRRDFPHSSRYSEYVPLVKQYGSDRETLINQILSKWECDAKKAATLGHELHAAMECRMKDPNYVIPVERGAEYEFGRRYLADLESKGWVPLYAERRIYQPKWRIAGSVDAMFVHRATRRCILVDWKRSKAIHAFAFGKKTGLGAASTVPDCNLWHYILQLNFYCVMLESPPYNMAFDDMFIVRLHPNAPEGAAEVFHVPCQRKLVAQILAERCI